ncbi:Vacuolar protein sorting-associated protein atg6 [Blastocladiella emersonii ATCC 22665]|nr:Vacuolar protein sorting-associated protein atg6 [Blastocladiella emersonii ATCC 22665]
MDPSSKAPPPPPPGVPARTLRGNPRAPAGSAAAAASSSSSSSSLRSAIAFGPDDHHFSSPNDSGSAPNTATTNTGGGMRCGRCKSALRATPAVIDDGVSQLSTALARMGAADRAYNPSHALPHHHYQHRGGGVDQSFILVAENQQQQAGLRATPPPSTTTAPLENSITDSMLLVSSPSPRNGGAGTGAVGPYSRSPDARTQSTLDGTLPDPPSAPAPPLPPPPAPATSAWVPVANGASEPEGKSRTSAQLATLERLHRELNALHNEPDLVLPACTSCVASMRALMAKELAAHTEELDAYRAFVASAEAAAAAAYPPGTATVESTEYTDAELARLLAEEAALERELAALEAEEADLVRERDLVEAEARDLDAAERAYWLELNAFHHSLAAFQAERDALNTKYDDACRQLARLKKTNVFNDVFRIGHDGVFATINGCRLGRSPAHPVGWPEINAGWGHACLLLDTLAKQLGFEFRGYRLLPMGSFSKVQKISTRTSSSSGTASGENSAASSATSSLTASTAVPTVADPKSSRHTDLPATPAAPPARIDTYDLHGSGGDFAVLGRLLPFNSSSRSFDTGLVAFLHCIAQLGDYCERLDDGFRLPYRIHKEKIGEISIRLQANAFGATDETWTRACKHVLTDLKWILAFVTKRTAAAQATPPPPPPPVSVGSARTRGSPRATTAAAAAAGRAARG